MNERFPYGEKFGTEGQDLPLPDENLAWSKMENLLDKEDGRRRFVPFLLRNCAAFSLLFLTAAVVSWFIFFNGENEKTKELLRQEISAQKSPAASSDVVKKTEIGQQLIKPTFQQENEDVTNEKREAPQPNKIARDETLQHLTKTKAIKRRSTVTTVNQPTGEQQKMVSSKEKTNTQPTVSLSLNSQIANNDTLVYKEEKKPANSQLTIDTASKMATPAVADSSAEIKRVKPKPTLIVSAGAGLFQGIPVAGQQAVAVNYKGKKGAVQDYLPSIYFQVAKENKWFAQAELQYAVPRAVKTFAYSRQTTYDAAATTVNTSTEQLKKTYYHQASASFNYFVLPQLSIGAGSTYNLFAGAVAEEEVNSKNIFTGVETVRKNARFIQGYKDSFLYRNTTLLLFQTALHWKAVSIGLRYTKDLQPYIRFTKPDGSIATVKNQSLQAVLRLRLWGKTSNRQGDL